MSPFLTHLERNGCLSLLVFLLLLFNPSHAIGGGPVHGAKASGMGTAFIAVANDPSAILHNPGGLTQLKGTQVYGGLTGVVVDTRYTSNLGTESTDFQVFFPPNLYITSDLGTSRWVIAFGVHSPFGIGGREWSGNGLLRYASVENNIATLAFNPTIAFRLNDAVSFAFGVDYMFASNQAKRRVDQAMLGAGDASFDLEGEGDGWGYNFGFLAKVNEQVRLGLAYRSGIEVDIDGDARLSGIALPLQAFFGGDRYKTDVDTKLDFPEIYSVGIAYDPHPDWTLALDVECVRWSSFDRLHTDFQNEVPAAGIVDGDTAVEWEDSWQIKFGFEYRLDDQWSLRGGYAFIPTPVPEHTLEPGNPDADSHNIHAGVGYRLGSWTIDGSYAVGFFEDRHVDNSDVKGEFQNTAHYLGLSLGKTF